ncbi:phage tail termination protein [Streptomyces sp. NPDC054871]
MAAVGSVDVELELIGRTQAQFGSRAVVRDELDNNLLDELPTIQIELINGDDDGFRLDRALVDFNVYAETRAEAIALAAELHGWILTQLRGSSSATAVISRTGTISRPAVRPYENTALRRVGGTYEIFSHPVS